MQADASPLSTGTADRARKTTVLDQPRGPRADVRMTPADTAAAIEPAGLEQVRIIELPPYHYASIFAKKVT